MRKLVSQALSTLSLVTRLPVPKPASFDLGRSDLFLPLVGLPVALVALLGAGLARLLLPSPIFQVLGALGLQYLCFNLFHLDGLLDSADALMPLASGRERRLEILKDSRIRSYAFAVGLFVTAVKAASLWYCLKLCPALPGSLAFFAYPVAGRAACALVPLLLKPAKAEGLGSLMQSFSPWRWALGFALALLPFALVIGTASGLQAAVGLQKAAALPVIALLAAFIAAGLVALPYKRKIGGFTGDSLGAAVEVGEALFLVLLSIYQLRF